TLNHVNADLAGKRLAGLLRYQVRAGEIGEAAKKSDASEPDDLRANQRQNRYALTVAHEHGPPHRANDVTPINANNGGYDVPPVQIGELHAECCEIEVNPALRPDSKACQSSQDNQADDPSSLLQACFAPCGESMTSMLRAETQERREWQCGRGLLLRNSHLQLVGERVRSGGSAGEHAVVEFMDDARHVGPGFRVRRDAAIAIYRLRAGVIGSQGQGEIA